MFDGFKTQSLLLCLVPALSGAMGQITKSDFQGVDQVEGFVVVETAWELLQDQRPRGEFLEQSICCRVDLNVVSDFRVPDRFELTPVVAKSICSPLSSIDFSVLNGIHSLQSVNEDHRLNCFLKSQASS